MVRSSLLAPLYVSSSWILIITHQAFTKTAITTVIEKFQIPLSASAASPWLSIDIFVFIYSFAWIFVLSSVIPSIILGKQRGVLMQFLVVLAITFVSSYIPTIIGRINIIQMNELFELSKVFQDYVFATIYLLLPFIFMLIIDLHGRITSTRNHNGFEEQS